MVGSMLVTDAVVTLVGIWVVGDVVLVAKFEDEAAALCIGLALLKLLVLEEGLNLGGPSS